VGRVAKKQKSLPLLALNYLPTYLPTHPSLSRYLVHTYGPLLHMRLFPAASERERDRERAEGVVVAASKPDLARPHRFPLARPAWAGLVVTGLAVSLSSHHSLFPSSLDWFGPPNPLHTQHKLFSLPCSSSDVSCRHNGCQSP
jgi:hypothetical protein